MESNALRASDPNFATLKGEDEYAKYFNLLVRVFRLMLACYPAEVAGSYEVGVVHGFLQKLLFTIEALRLKYAYTNPQRPRPLWVDTTNSGFPNAAEIGAVVQDLLSQKERLRALPAKSILKRGILDALLQEHREPAEVLWQLSEREYLDHIDESKLFLPFTPGELVSRGEQGDQRQYAFSWGCYDFASNRPYIHIMSLTQDTWHQPLEEGGAEWSQFLQVVRNEGSRAPDVGILAYAIDDALDGIHPKILKRLCIGPLYARQLLTEEARDGEDPAQEAFRQALADYGRDENDFVLFATDEIVFSREQKVTRGILNPRGKVREIFAITELDPDCMKRRASMVHHNVVMPHWVLQNVRQDLEAAVPEFTRCRKITYNDREEVEVHGI